MHCIDCDRHIVIDGVHRITWIALDNPGVQLKVTEISGRWPTCTPDMNVICECENRPQHDLCVSPYRGRCSMCPSEL